ncbi:MAG TPA: OmpA family protein, partial [Candidatus Ozemobacteraceae bacterium]|nr:OmpA family protein [Candidatus Ozemobacteraceae bacterium]
KIMGFSTSIRLTIDENDIRIDLVDSQPAGLFGSVLERFTPLLQQMLGEIAAIVRDMPNRIVIEGHTNSVPYQGPAGESNWELSIERANMARMILEQQGVQNQQIIELRGCADQFLLDKIDPMSLTNRRISIVIKRRMPYYPEINGVFGQ